MTARQQWSIVLTVVVLLAGGLFAATRFFGEELFPVSVGSRAPSFKALTVDGTAKPKSLADYKGEVVVLNVWATWCAPCVIEMPSLEKLHREMAARGLKVIAVSIDDPGSEPAIRQFAKEHGLTFEILHDPDGAIKRQYQTTGVPETFVIGRDGVIRKKAIGARLWDSEGNRALIAQLLSEQG